MPGAKTRFEIHPLFLLVGILTAFTGQLLIFLAAVLAALEHECAHAFCARRYGFVLDRIVLMPYGAVLKGDMAGMGRKQEIAVCLAGPFASGATALGFVALWWLFPETYAYTDVAAYVTASLCIVNLLPAWPLDGGRILYLLLRPLGERKATIICRIITLCVAAGVLGYFVWSCFTMPAFTALAFALLLGVGAFGGGSYRRVSLSRNFRRGVEEVRIAVSADVTVQEALRFLREDRYLTLLLFEDEHFCGELSEEEFLSAVEKGGYGETLGSLVSL